MSQHTEATLDDRQIPVDDIGLLDRWRHLRTDLYGNVEPRVDIVGLTCPGEIPAYPALGRPVPFMIDQDLDGCVSADVIEAQVAEAAAVSTGIEPKDAAKLNRSLIRMGHLTPLEAIQFNFRVSGISKACGAQISRHRVGQGHVSSSRRYRSQGAAFVYPLLNGVSEEAEAKDIYRAIEGGIRTTGLIYSYLRGSFASLSKGDARYVIPVSSAQERIWWINARALREFFRLRTHATAEAEIRRLAFMMLALVRKITPSLFTQIDGM